MATRIGVDIGGTFTDLVVYDDRSGEVSVEKVPSTPAYPEKGCIAAVYRAAERLGGLDSCEYFLHGTTVGLNALLERRGAIVGLLCTDGFRDTLEIRRGSRPEHSDLTWAPPEPLVPRHLRLPVVERMNASGAVVRPLQRQGILDAVKIFEERGVTAVAVCFINSYTNPAHEIEAAKILREAGFKGDVSLSHQLSREYRDYERLSTTAIDAFVRARMAEYLDNVVTGLSELGYNGGCLITRSGGGSMTFEESRNRAFETINSGPVAGAEGAAELTRALGLGDLVTADVGGTSFDTTLIVNGRAQLLYQGEIAGMPIQAPWVDVRSVGAGGGSIAHVDAAGLLHVGPQSAGAQPGPACYQRGGTEPTVTDAAFFLGMLGSGNLASNVNLDKGLAETALNSVGKQLDIDARAVAVGIIEIACSNCANTIREITVEQGVDPRSLKLLAFGGAGPLLATEMARELDIRTVVVPPFAGNFSAWGLLGSDVIRAAARSQIYPVTPESVASMTEIARAMFAEQEEGLDESSRSKELRYELNIGMRYAGQEHSLTVPVPWENDRIAWDAGELDKAFRDSYLAIFGIALDSSVQAIVLRTEIRTPLPRTAVRPASVAGESKPLGVQALYSFARKQELEAQLWNRASLLPGERHQGPAVIYEATTTTYVDTDFSFGVDQSGCIILTREG